MDKCQCLRIYTNLLLCHNVNAVEPMPFRHNHRHRSWHRAHKGSSEQPTSDLTMRKHRETIIPVAPLCCGLLLR